MAVVPGDLIHADGGGAVVVPKNIAAEVPETAERVLAKEAELLSAIRADDFSLEDLVKRFYS